LFAWNLATGNEAELTNTQLLDDAIHVRSGDIIKRVLIFLL
jgi:hypothetical protein